MRLIDLKTLERYPTIKYLKNEDLKYQTHKYRYWIIKALWGDKDGFKVHVETKTNSHWGLEAKYWNIKSRKKGW